ncbi:MAG: M42 family metallopeptidase [Anaerolineae bacterium]
MDIFALLRRLTETPGIPGHEGPVRAVIEEEMRPLVDEMRTDALGSLVGLKRATRREPSDSPAPRIMLAAHMDQIGFMVSGIAAGGFLRIVPVGGIDERTLAGQEVAVHAAEGTIPGVIATRPPHLLTGDQGGKVIELGDLFVDLGLSEADVRARIAVGDPITFRRPMIEWLNGRVAGPAMDNRASVACLLATLAALQRAPHAWDVYAVATVQEEFGFRGAITATFHIMPQVGIAIDVGFGQQPGAPDDQTFPLGQGPSVGFGPNIHPRIHNRLMATAREYEIPVHVEPMPGSSGTDAMVMQVAQSGVATGVLSLPTRYMHSPVETLAVRDIDRTARLLALFISDLDDAFVTALTDW